MRRALLYCTFNGISNCTNGIGRQAQTFLGALQRRWNELTASAGPFTPYVAFPAPGPQTWAYDPRRLAASSNIVRSRGGQLIALHYDEQAEFWIPGTWQQLSAGAADAAGQLARDFDQVVVIAVDTPFAGTASAFGRSQHDGQVRILLTLYGTTWIHDHPGPDPARLTWERDCLTAASEPGVRVADVGDFMTRHLIGAYKVDPSRLVPWRSSLDLTAPDLQPMTAARARSIAAAHGVPLDRPIVLTIGRTDPVKGIDLLIDAARPLRHHVHVVIIAVPFDGFDPLIPSYRHHIRDAGLRATLIPYFTRQLPRALASLPVTRAVTCPARGEPLANVPFEVGLWARRGGPVVVAPARDGFPEQLTDGINGILYDPHHRDGLTRAMTRALSLNPATREAMCHAAWQRVASSRDVVANLTDTLRHLLPPGPPER